MRAAQDQFCFLPEELHHLKQTDLRAMFKKFSKKGCTTTVAVYPDSLSHALSTYSAMKTPENIKEGPYAPKPAAEEDTKVEYTSD